MNKIFDFLDDYKKRRVKLAHVYVKEFGNLILEKQISANVVMNLLAQKYNTSRQNVYVNLRKAGVYKNKAFPVVPEADKYEEYNKTIEVVI